MSEQQITDNGREGKYFHLMVNMADDDLGVYQYRLYGHYKRVCGESADGVCWEGTRTTAKKCQMSVGKVTSTRRELVDLGYIQITAGAKDETLAITLQDMMETNVKRYAKRSPHEHTVHHMNTDVHHMNTLPVEGCSPHEPKNNSLLQEPSEESARADDDDKHAVEYAVVGNTNSTTPSKKVSADSTAKTPPTPNSARSPSPGRVRFPMKVFGGEDRYADGHFIAVDTAEFTDACNGIFYAWLDTLEELGRRPDTSTRTLWEKYREAIKALAVHRRTPEQIEAFVRYVYSDKYRDGFYSNNPSPITPMAISNGIAAWLQTQKPKQTILFENHAPLYPPAVRLTPEQIAQRRADKDRILAEYQ